MKLLIANILLFNLTFAESLKIKLVDISCKKEQLGQLFVAVSDKLVYQIEAPISAAVALNLPKEKYKVSYITKDGCEAFQEIDLQKDLQIELKVEKKK